MEYPARLRDQSRPGCARGSSQRVAGIWLASPYGATGCVIADMQSSYLGAAVCMNRAEFRMW
jgi:hypothetical protein